MQISLAGLVNWCCQTYVGIRTAVMPAARCTVQYSTVQ